MNHKHSFMLGAIALCLVPLAQVHASTTSKKVLIEGLGRVPQDIVLMCEKAVGDGGHESFHDVEWDLFTDCVNHNLRRN